jgi:RNA polymerase sigma-70 factor, ECF subfamily
VSFSVTTGFHALPMESDAPTKSCVTERTQPLLEELCDEDLMLAVSTGAKDALAILFGRYARLVRTLGKRILRECPEADDLVQEVFLYIHRRSGLFDRSKGSARSWIIQVAYTQALIRRRELKSHGFYSSGIMDKAPEKRFYSPEGTNSLDSIEELFGKNGWKNVWGSLTECQRETFRLHFYEGCTFGEIAEKLGESYVNIRHHYYRGLEKLRKHADDNGLNWP